MSASVRIVRAVLVISLSSWFVGTVFGIARAPFWTAGIGDWMDPYFINYLLEHWNHSVRTLSDPSSPPMYFPAPRTLGYSHGLVLFAPYYLLVRPFLHPFQAYSAALFLVVEVGILCLYALLRRSFSLTFVESLLLTLFFATSLNVMNGFIGVWSQRASVFLIPPSLLLLVAARARAPGRFRTAGLFVSGLLALLMLTQDFYTAFFALCFIVVALVMAGITRPGRVQALRQTWRHSSRSQRTAFVVASLLVAWAGLVAVSGGFTVTVLGVRIASHDSSRPALLAAIPAALLIFSARKNGWSRAAATGQRWFMPFAAGAIAGLAVFLWIYAAAYREHPSFPDEHLSSSLVAIDTSRGGAFSDIVEKRAGYETLRTFKFVLAVAVLAWMPWFNVSRRTKLLCLSALVVSLIVLVIPLTFGGFSIWRTFLAPFPGFSAIRDPKRIAYLYELSVVLAAAAFMSSLPWRSALRVTTSMLLVGLLVTERNSTVFDYLRPNATFDKWVSAPVAVGPSCRSFYVAPAGPIYSQRSTDQWTLYSIDAMFIALATSVPTLNGYSAWFPKGWGFQNPENPGYRDAVRRWVSTNRLTGVCELDITQRTMTPSM
jgi:hypothetical protein